MSPVMWPTFSPCVGSLISVPPHYQLLSIGLTHYMDSGIMGVLTIPRAIRDHQDMLMATFEQIRTQASEKLTVALEAVPKASQLKGDASKKEQ